MFSESIYTVEEVAQHLRVSVNVVNTEIDGGRLKALRVGESKRIQESELDAYKRQALSSSAEKHYQLVSVELDSTDDFTHTWPDKSTEQYTSAREGVVQHDGRDYHVKIGFANRKVVGKLRRRALVLVNGYPTVEFASRDTAEHGLIASVIKDRSGKQVPVRAVPPLEYAEMPVRPYREIVDGPGARNGLAVICNSDDLPTMVRHALIRSTYRQERKKERKSQ